MFSIICYSNSNCNCNSNDNLVYAFTQTAHNLWAIILSHSLRILACLKLTWSLCILAICLAAVFVLCSIWNYGNLPPNLVQGWYHAMLKILPKTISKIFILITNNLQSVTFYIIDSKGVMCTKLLIIVIMAKRRSLSKHVTAQWRKL